MKPSELARLLDGANGEAIAVVGDVMLDKFVWGRVSRISPEAPVPVVEIADETYHLGGAANVAANLLTLGARPVLVGVVGEDDAGHELRSALAAQNLADDHLLGDASRPTTVKTRIIAHSQQVVRADRESTADLTGASEARFLERLGQALEGAKAVVLSDYAKGALTPAIIERTIALAEKRSVPVLVDPKLRRYQNFRGVRLVTPNLLEAERVTGRSVEDDTELGEVARLILDELSCDAVLVTRGEQGMSLFERAAEPLHIPATAREVFDVTGAGDTVVAAAALSLAAGTSLPQAAIVANMAAGIVVGKLGTATVRAEELIAACQSEDSKGS